MKKLIKKNNFVGIIALCISIAIFIGCSGPNAPIEHHDNTDKNGPSASEVSGPTFDKEISDIFSRRCASCHGAGGALPNWNDYATAFVKRDRINQRLIIERTMPPKEVSTITDEERATIGRWIQAGAPRNHVSQTIQTGGPGPAATPPIHTPSSGGAGESNSPSPSGEGSSELSFDGGISKIFANRCGLCHVAGGTLPNWADYEIAFAKKDRIFQRVIVDRSMPPQGISTMTDEERAKIEKWIQAGAPKTTSKAEPPISSAPFSKDTNPSNDIDFAPIQKTINQCIICHTNDSRQSLPIFARLKGQTALYLETELRAFRSKKRRDKNAVDYMFGPTSLLDDESIHLLAVYFSVQKPNSAATATSVEIEKGKDLFEKGNPVNAVSSCVGCHGQHGEGTTIAPRLAGQSKEYLLNQFKAFKEGTREEAQMMPNISKNLDANEESALAIYLESI